MRKFIRMHRIFLTFALLTLGIVCLEPCTAQQTPPATTKPAPELTTEKDKLSYAIGMKIGRGLKGDSVDVDQSILIQGLKDAMSGGNTRLTEEECKALLSDLSAELNAKKQAELHRIGEANKQAEQLFLVANKAREGIVTLPSGLQYKILDEGTGPKPTTTDTVICNYRGTLLDGTQFDSSQKRGQPSTVSVSQVIEGWKEALQLMPVGSKWRLFVPSELGYGDRSPVAGIGPNSMLIFELELLAIKGKNQ
jgi:FKBP-type peptidyl-prolyl cis-trans isomerase FklB